MEPGEVRLTVAAAEERVLAMTGETRSVHALIEACLNAEAAFHMLGCKPVGPAEFQPVGVQTMMQIGELLATMPDETALVKAAMAFACEGCGCPAEHSDEDGCWTCDSCLGEPL